MARRISYTDHGSRSCRLACRTNRTRAARWCVKRRIRRNRVTLTSTRGDAFNVILCIIDRQGSTSRHGSAFLCEQPGFLCVSSGIDCGNRNSRCGTAIAARSRIACLCPECCSVSNPAVLRRHCRSHLRQSGRGRERSPIGLSPFHQVFTGTERLRPTRCCCTVRCKPFRICIGRRRAADRYVVRNVGSRNGHLVRSVVETHSILSQ